MSKIEEQISKARASLAALGRMRAESDRADGQILQAARARLARIEADLVDARASAMTDPEQAQRYQSIVQERGRIAALLARTRGSAKS